jgi:hypothetical protein
LPRRLHHDRRHAQTNGGTGREREKRDPHGSLFLLRFTFGLVVERPDNVVPGIVFRELFEFCGKITPISTESVLSLTIRLERSSYSNDLISPTALTPVPAWASMLVQRLSSAVFGGFLG